jgi:hypothetical protein
VIFFPRHFPPPSRRDSDKMESAVGSAKTSSKARTWTRFAGRVRVAAKRFKLRAIATALLSCTSAAAETMHAENRCPKLSTEGYEELDARLQLLLQSEGDARPLPAIVCIRAGSWVEWDGRRFDILGRASLVDEVVDIVEAQLHDAQRKRDSASKTTEDAAVAAGQPMLQRGSGTPPPPPTVRQPADRVAVRPSDARGGGIALGVESELPSDTIGAAVGPAFDFAASVGPLLVGGREALRFSVSGRRVSFMDFQAAVAYGAPFVPGARFGAVVRFGAEWMVAYPSGNSGQAAVAPVTDIGVRVAHAFGPVGLWLGIDAHFRLAELSLRSQSPLVANDVGGSCTLGVAFVDWSRK